MTNFQMPNGIYSLSLHFEKSDLGKGIKNLYSSGKVEITEERTSQKFYAAVSCGVWNIHAKKKVSYQLEQTSSHLMENRLALCPMF